MRGVLRISGSDGSAAAGFAREVRCDDPRGLTIGRSEDNGLVLPDGGVSAQHARVLWLRGIPHIEDLRSSNGTLLGGRPLEPYQPMPLESGDNIEIYPYQIAFDTSEESLRCASGQDEAGRDDSMPGSRGGERCSKQEESDQGQVGGNIRPESVLPGRPPSQGDLPGRTGKRGPAGTGGRVPAGLPEVDIEGDTSFTKGNSPRVPQKEEDGKSVSSRPRNSPSVESPPSEQAIDENLLRTVINAFRDILRVREELRNAIRAEHSLLAKTGNNPLKYSPTTDEALRRLTAADGNSWLDFENAIREAAIDIKTHELAMLVAMKHAFRVLLERFDPENMIVRADRRSQSILSRLQEDSRYWKEYCSFYAESTEDVEDSWQNLFGREFQKAYDREVRRLRNDAKNGNL